MPVITASDVPTTKAELPDGFCKSVILRCLEAKFGPSKSSGKPMITVDFEIVGIRKSNDSDELLTEVVHNGVTYVIAGQRVNSIYISLSGDAVKYYKPLWAKFTGLPVEQFTVDTDNPDLSHFQNLAISAVVQANTVPKRAPLTEEQKAAGKTEGDIVVDEDGKPLVSKYVEIVKNNREYSFNRRFTGELPPF